MAKLSEEIAAYERMQDVLEADHFGEWVVVRDGELIGAYPAFEDAADAAVSLFGRGPYLIRKVGRSAIRLSPSLLYGLR